MSVQAFSFLMQFQSPVVLFSLIISNSKCCDFSGKALAYTFDDLYGGLMLSHKYYLPSKDYPGTLASCLSKSRTCLFKSL